MADLTSTQSVDPDAILNECYHRTKQSINKDQFFPQISSLLKDLIDKRPNITDYEGLKDYPNEVCNLVVGDPDLKKEVISNFREQIPKELLEVLSEQDLEINYEQFIIGELKEYVRKTLIEASNSRSVLKQIPYDNYSVRFNDKQEIVVQKNDTQLSNQGLGYKLHVSIDKANLGQGYKIITELVEKHGLTEFKLSHNPDGGGKQFTVYCANESPDKVQAFIMDLEERLIREKIQPDTNRSDDCKSINGSKYISFRNDFFELGTPAAIKNTSSNYVSGTHLRCAKIALEQLGAENIACMDEQSFRDKFEGNIERAEGIKIDIKDKFYADMKKIVMKAKENQEKCDGEVCWHNIGGHDDTFGLALLDLSVVSQAKKTSSFTDSFRRISSDTESQRAVGGDLKTGGKTPNNECMLAHNQIYDRTKMKFEEIKKRTNIESEELHDRPTNIPGLGRNHK